YDPLRIYIYHLSLHDALPIFEVTRILIILVLVHPFLDENLEQAAEKYFLLKLFESDFELLPKEGFRLLGIGDEDIVHTHEVRFVDRKSTRLNSSHVKISYAVF